jgi:hypothetical protein
MPDSRFDVKVAGNFPYLPDRQPRLWGFPVRRAISLKTPSPDGSGAFFELQHTFF